MPATEFRPYLENQSDIIEKTLLEYGAPARVTGGNLGPRLIQFYISPAEGVRVAAIERLAVELSRALRADSARITTAQGFVILEIPNPKPRPVDGLKLIKGFGDSGRALAALGITGVNTRLGVRLSSPDVPHILISGTTGSGKSALLKTISASLALLNSPDEIRLSFIDPKGRTFQAFKECRPDHLIEIVEDGPSAVALISRLVLEMERRDKGRFNSPALVCIIEELADLIMVSPEIEKPLTRILQRGREAGVHIIAATQRPSAAILSGLMRANFPLRLVGRVVSAQDSTIATGQKRAGAELLQGRGDFLAVRGSDVIRFQAGFTLESGLREALSNLKSGAPRYELEAAPVDPIPGGAVSVDWGMFSEAEGESARVMEAAAMLRPVWSRLGPALEAGQRGAKNAAVRIAFPQCQRPGGRFMEWTDRAIEILKGEFTTATATGS